MRRSRPYVSRETSTTLELNIHSGRNGTYVRRGTSMWLSEPARTEKNSGLDETRRRNELATVLRKSSVREHSWPTGRDHCCANTDVRERPRPYGRSCHWIDSRVSSSAIKRSGPRFTTRGFMRDGFIFGPDLGQRHFRRLFFVAAESSRYRDLLCCAGSSLSSTAKVSSEWNCLNLA